MDNYNSCRLLLFFSKGNKWIIMKVLMFLERTTKKRKKREQGRKMEIDNSIRDNLQIIIKVGTRVRVIVVEAQKTWNPFPCLLVVFLWWLSTSFSSTRVRVALTYSHIFWGIFVTWEWDRPPPSFLRRYPNPKLFCCWKKKASLNFIINLIVSHSPSSSSSSTTSTSPYTSTT